MTYHNINLLSKALEYAQRGWNIVPDHGVTPIGGCTCGDPGCKVAGKHPRMERDSAESHWRGTGTRDLKVIKEWWQRWPDSNLAIVCGKDSNLVAIDIDPRNGGLESWKDLCRNHSYEPNTITSQSGGGGLHILFSHPQYFEVRNRIGLFPGIDVKADGGRIVAPPSQHKSGARYAWQTYDVPLQTIPDWLLEIIQNQKGTGTWQAMKSAAEPRQPAKKIRRGRF